MVKYANYINKCLGDLWLYETVTTKVCIVSVGIIIATVVTTCVLLFLSLNPDHYIRN